MRNDTNAYYDAIAEYYPLFYRDWDVQLEREGLGLRSIFRNKGILRVLDAACGPGTQAIPLAKLNFQVVAAEPSQGMLRKARETAKQHGVADQIQFVSSEFAHLAENVQGPFDAIVCKGNALPHLLTDDEIETTLLTFYELLRPGGLLVIGMRDFEPFLEHRPRYLPGILHQHEDGSEFITFEVWEWDEGPPIIATQHIYMVSGKPDALQAIKRTVSYRPLSVAEVQVVLGELGYEEISEYPDRWEQVLIARRPLGS